MIALVPMPVALWYATAAPGWFKGEDWFTGPRGSQECEFLPLQLEVPSKNALIIVLQAVNQNIQKFTNSPTSNFKCSKKNINHADVRLMGLQ